VVVDKNGTLTEGKPKLVTVDNMDALAIGSQRRTAERASLATAIVAGAIERGLTLSKVEDFSGYAPSWRQRTVDGRRVSIGNTMPAELSERARPLLQDGQTVVYVRPSMAVPPRCSVGGPDQGVGRGSYKDFTARWDSHCYAHGPTPRDRGVVASKLGIDRCWRKFAR